MHVDVDVWDYDLGAQPTLVDFPTTRGNVPALLLPTKQGDIRLRYDTEPDSSFLKRAARVIHGSAANRVAPVKTGLNRTQGRRGIVGMIFSVLAWIGSHEFSVLVSVVVLGGGVWAFIELADEVTELETVSVDERLLLSLRNPADVSDPVGPGWVEEMGRDFTALGGTSVLTLITLATLGYLLLANRKRTALFTLAAVSGGMLLSTLLKMGFGRPRPDLVPHESIVYTASFPSGHSMMSAVTYLTLAAILSRVHSPLIIKAYLLIVAMVVALLVGVSRVYLGVHWPTDVLAGWVAGAAWAAFCWLVARWLQRRHVVEDEIVTVRLDRSVR